ncbi:MAG TPA: ABC transporter substrate-binding protein [Chloroflexota bacterium]
MKSPTPLALASLLILAACGGTAAPASSPAPANSAAPVAASVKPSAAVSAAASAKPSAAVSGGASAKPAASTSAAGQPTPMTVAYVGISGGDLPLWTANDTGIFKKNGLDVKVVISTSSSSGMISDLIAGQLQVVWTDGTNAVSADANGADLVIIAMIHPQYGYLLMAPASIKTPADLKGKKIAVSNLTGTDAVATKEALPKLGLDPQKDVTFVPVASNSNRTAALLSGAAQATMLDPPGTLQLESQGFHSIADTTTMNLPSTNASLNVQRSYTASHRDAVQKFIDSIVEGIALDKKDKAMGVAIMKKYEKSDDDKAMQITYDFYNPITPSLPYPKQDNLANAVDQLSGENPKLKTVDLSKIIDPSFVQSAADRKLDQA